MVFHRPINYADQAYDRLPEVKANGERAARRMKRPLPDA